MEGKNPTEELRRTIAGFLAAGGFRFSVDAEQDFAVFIDALPDTVVWCMPRALEGGASVVLIAAFTNLGVRVDDELKRYLTAANNRQLFGKFVIHQERPDVLFVHALLGDFLNRAELECAVWAVGRSAEGKAAEIKRRWGGRTFTEPAA